MSGYTIVRHVHVCPKPSEPLPFGTIIRCDACGKRWVRYILGWAPAEAKP